ncbi:MAG: ComEC/Rec2 family competence protein [Candidatus Saccharibacteria bacterium]|nr:ComEC/Rec2 family competence protein [Candidatus Saccharibacteria bacterium]
MRARLFHKPIHVSWIFAATAGGVLVGAAGSLLIPPGLFAALPWLVVAGALLSIALLKRELLFVLLAFISGCFVGLYRGTSELWQLQSYEPFYGRQVRLQGVVADDTTRGSSGDQRLRLGDVVIDGEPLPGYVWISTTSNAEIKRSDVVVVKGVLNDGFGTLSGSMFRAELIEAERPEPGDVARQVRDWFTEQVRGSVPEPEASLGVSYVAGQKRALPQTLSDEFRLLGLSHLVVASGFHLTIIVKATRKALAGRSKYLAMFFSGLMIGGFLLLTGFSTSMTRASLVAGLSLTAWYYGRVVHPVVLLLLVAAMTLLINPSFIWGDVGWFLSFAAFSGVIILAPLLHRYFWGSKKPGYVRDLLVATTAAQITTLPIVLVTFGFYSPLALLSNLLILPLVPVVMLLTVVAGMSSALLPMLAGLIGLPAYAVLWYMTSLTGWLSSIPWAHHESSLSIPGLVMSYIAMVLVAVYIWRKTGHDFRKETPI